MPCAPPKSPQPIPPWECGAETIATLGGSSSRRADGAYRDVARHIARPSCSPRPRSAVSRSMPYIWISSMSRACRKEPETPRR